MINLWFLSLGIDITVQFIQLLLIIASECSNIFLPISDLKDYDSSTENLIIFNKNICTRCFQKDVSKRACPSLNLCTFLCKNLMYYNIEGFIYAIK